MEITYRIDKDVLYVSVHGRVDASNASDAENRIIAIKNENADKHLVIDADELEYISSAGLRVILRLRKENPKLAIINVAADVYEVLDMTGFTDMINVQKAYRRISIDGCEMLGKGANGAVYRYDEETIVKTYYNVDSLPEIQQERENARIAFVNGVNTAIPYGIVRIGEGYGTVTELLEATSISKMIKKDPSNLEIPAKFYVDMIKNIHSIKLEAGLIPNAKETVLDWAEFVAPKLPEAEGKKLLKLVAEIPERDTMIHGDYHTNNIMVRNDEALLIDMDTLSTGHPVIEFGSMFNAFVGYGETDHNITLDFLGYPYDVAEKFWKIVLKMYFETDSDDFVSGIEEKAMIIGYTRMMRRAIRRNESEEKITRCYNQLVKLLNKVETLDF
jgi:uncharacterized protein (TIGR02172 family)